MTRSSVGAALCGALVPSRTNRTRRDAPSRSTTPWAGHGDGGASPLGQGGRDVRGRIGAGILALPQVRGNGRACPSRRRPAVPVACKGCRGRTGASLRERCLGSTFVWFRANPAFLG